MGHPYWVMHVRQKQSGWSSHPCGFPLLPTEPPSSRLAGYLLPNNLLSLAGGGGQRQRRQEGGGGGQRQRRQEGGGQRQQEGGEG